MRKKIAMLGLGMCLFAAACSGKNTTKDDASDRNTESIESTNENGLDEAQKDKAKEKNEENASSAQTDQEGEDNGVPEKEISKAPEVTFVDYSQNIKDEQSGILLLSVTENCPVITIEENPDAAERMNLVFEQQRTINQGEIDTRVENAKSSYKELSEQEAASWSGYGYGVSYKVVYASTRILSIEMESYDWEGSTQPNTWTSSYCFDVRTGGLLSLVDVLEDEESVRMVVSDHILNTITKEPYKDALLDDYESYVNDVLTENTFYLNETGLVVICNPYMVTSPTAGKIEIEIPYEELKDMLNPEYILN